MVMSTRGIELGCEVADIVTDFCGIATARLQHLNGCVQYLVVPRVKADDPTKRPDGEWIDSQQLSIIGTGINLGAWGTQRKDAPGSISGAVGQGMPGLLSERLAVAREAEGLQATGGPILDAPKSYRG